MFTGRDNYDPAHGDAACRGLFYECDGNAVSGSGGEVWYKVVPELVAFCKDVDKVARGADVAIQDPCALLILENLKMATEDYIERINTFRKEIDRQEMILDALRAANQKEEEKLEKHQERVLKYKVDAYEKEAEEKKAAKRPRGA
jgi:hypothetical protein